MPIVLTTQTSWPDISIPAQTTPPLFPKETLFMHGCLSSYGMLLRWRKSTENNCLVKICSVCSWIVGFDTATFGQAISSMWRYGLPWGVFHWCASHRCASHRCASHDVLLIGVPLVGHLLLAYLSWRASHRRASLKRASKRAFRKRASQ
jgi:hypothetical protein